MTQGFLVPERKGNLMKCIVMGWLTGSRSWVDKETNAKQHQYFLSVGNRTEQLRGKPIDTVTGEELKEGAEVFAILDANSYRDKAGMYMADVQLYRRREGYALDTLLQNSLQLSQDKPLMKVS